MKPKNDNDGVSSAELEALQKDYCERISPLIPSAMEMGALRKAALDRDRLASFDADDQRRRPAYVFVPGDRVVFTGKALNSMGVKVGAEVARVWTVRECGCGLCQLGRHVCTDQELADGSGWRHIARQALRLENQPSGDDIDNMPTEECGRGIVFDSRKVTYPPRRAAEQPWAPGSLAPLLDQLEELELGRKERMH